MSAIKSGTFIRVRYDHEQSPNRAGMDGMVTEDVPEGCDDIPMIFGYDRHCWPQNVQCVGTELWHRSELDMSTAA